MSNAAAPPRPPLPIEGSSDHYLSQDAAAICAQEVHEAGAVEVFFIGRRNESGLVVEVESHAYGTANTVPAIINQVRPGEVLIHNHPSGQLLPSDADLSVASQVGNMGVGFYIIDNRCARCRVVVRPQDPRRKVMLAPQEVEERLRPGGRLARVVEGYEDRPEQRAMAATVAKAFNHDGIAVIEAGTGTGKSFAYLVPAVMYALRNNERVVVSTATINLQEQLLNKDVPAVRRALGEEFDVEIVKGRSNYVCKRKASYAAAEAQTLIEDEFQTELRGLLDWIATTPTGDKGELPVQPRYEAWERVQSEADNCLRVRCPFYEECFYYNSRRRAARAKLLIVNHALLLSDLSVRRSSGNWSAAAVLPPYNRVVLDEAHHLEEAATNNLATQITRPGVRNLLGRLHRRDSKGGNRGVLLAVSDEVTKHVKAGVLDVADPRVQTLEFEILARVSDLRDNMDFMLDDFGRRFMQLAGVTNVRPGEDQKIRLKGEHEHLALWADECVTLLLAMAGELAQFLDANTKLIEQFEELDADLLDPLVNPIMEWRALLGRIDAVRKALLAFQAEDAAMCRWVELSQPTGGRSMMVRICLAPVDVRELLRESLHDRMKSEVLTSATLTVDRKFTFFQERSGLPLIGSDKPAQQYDEDGTPIIERDPVEARPIELQLLKTPFDYRQQVFMAVPTDMPDPREGNFDDRLADMINRAVTITGGRAFILFTSYGQLNRLYERCYPYIRSLGIEVLRQGNQSRERLLANFREDETSVLFATSSFWEGVDVKGRALELLIIVRLPFSVPTEPIQEAQYEAMEAQGRDPFTNLVIPRAVVRFKQGFGRLIRARTDRGAVIITDRRVATMRYGRRFIHSLPDLDLRQGKTMDMLAEMRTFFANRPPDPRPPQAPGPEDVPF